MKIKSRNCFVCKKNFKPKDNLKAGKFCSQTCYWKDMSNRKGETTPAWKEKVSYSGIHRWVNKELGKPSYCEFCKKTDEGKYQWANISNLYLRDVNDWLRLCLICHAKWDRLAQKKWLTQKKKKKVDITAIDFDGTICDRDKISGEDFRECLPKEFAKKALDIFIKNGHYCYVFTAREPQDWRHIAYWMFKNNLPGIPIHNIKLKGITRVIDDRAIRFTNWQDVCHYFR